MRPQHLQDVIRQDAGMAALLLEALDGWCLACLQGTCQQRPRHICAARSSFLCANRAPGRTPGGYRTLGVR